MSFVVPNPTLKAEVSSGTKGFLDARATVRSFGIRPGMRVADFGCGFGYFTMLMAHEVGDDGRVIALDVQLPALESVRAKAKDDNLSNIETVHADLEISGSSGLADGSQDFVLIANVLFQSQKKEAILGEAKRVLDSAGRLVVLEWDKGAGGFGPPDDLRMNRASMQKLIEGQGLVFERLLETGQYHYGMVFTKP